ncbi:MAG: sigma-54-dependent Fis family transcriptional regulator [Gemmatimonadaceae bacterium]|nr:sigma-54-dependent Fis family transcriptional regulator [Gemmatimonadaceae bacterium]
MTLSLLVIDDDSGIRETLVEFFESFGYTARGAATATDGRRLAQEHAPDVIVLDLKLPDADGLIALQALRADDPEVAVVLLTGFADVRTTVRAMHSGAADVLEKPVDLEMLAAAVERAAKPRRLQQEIELLRAQARAPITGTDVPFDAAVGQLIELAARNADAPVLLQGETGTGKGYVARLIHDASARRDAPFVEINCASLSPTFFESDLFGHERGAFTDARQAKRGLLEVAGSGTVFLDEVAELSLEVQPRLLKVLEERSFRRLGGTIALKSNARLIVATHQSLSDAVADRRFRADLFYRLQVLTIALPPLRERPQDILRLAATFLAKGVSLDNDASDALVRYEWPGNVRELKNTLWRASILADGGRIAERHLGLTGAASHTNEAAAPTRSPTPISMIDVERDAIRRALHATGGNRSRAARELGIARSTLLEKIKRLNL